MLNSLIDKFKSLDTDKIIMDSFNDTHKSFEDRQRDQLSKGYTNDGKKISPKYRSRKYAHAKNEMNPIPGLGTPDLRLTGAFYAGIDMDTGKNSLDIISKDEKGPELEHKYKNIFGLGGVHKSQYLKESFGPKMRGKISKFTGLKFS